MRRKFHAIGSLVEGPVEGSNEEHHDLGTHTQKQHEIGTWQVSQFEERTKNHD